MTTLKAESTAIISEVRVKEGDAVSQGAVLLVTELMKMQHEILAPVAGTVTDIRAQVGMQMAAGDVILTLDDGEDVASS